MKRLVLPFILAFAVVPAAQAAGGRYVFDGGTRAQRGQVTSALQASSFDWSLVPGRVVIHIGNGISSHAVAGQIWPVRFIHAVAKPAVRAASTSSSGSSPT